MQTRTCEWLWPNANSHCRSQGLQEWTTESSSGSLNSAFWNEEGRATWLSASGRYLSPCTELSPPREGKIHCPQTQKQAGSVCSSAIKAQGSVQMLRGASFGFWEIEYFNSLPKHIKNLMYMSADAFQNVHYTQWTHSGPEHSTPRGCLQFSLPPAATISGRQQGRPCLISIGHEP